MRYISVIILALLFFSCKSESPVETVGTPTSAYNRINTITSGGIRFEMYSATGSMLFNGYNDIGFKVFINNDEKKSGSVAFKPMMFHFPGDRGHSSPVSESFYYNSEKNLFEGYVNFIMVSDSSGIWAGYYTYNDSVKIDSIPFNVGVLESNLLLTWSNVNLNSYVLTLINPQVPKLGLNTFSVMLHKTNDYIKFSEVDSAQMSIYPWMVNMGHSSSSNINPVFMQKGRYEGKVNFNMTGLWDVYDTIKVNGVNITNIPPPKFTFTAQ